MNVYRLQSDAGPNAAEVAGSGAELRQPVDDAAGAVAGLFAIAEGLQAVSKALIRLGNNDAPTNMGAIEALGAAVLDGSERIALALGSR
jgi:hypothetical protein